MFDVHLKKKLIYFDRRQTSYVQQMVFGGQNTQEDKESTTLTLTSMRNNPQIFFKWWKTRRLACGGFSEAVTKMEWLLPEVIYCIWAPADKQNEKQAER